MDLRKGLSFTAFGFLFVLVNFNLTAGARTVNVMPEFVGWLLLTLAIDKLGKYTENRRYLKVMALVLLVYTAAEWVLNITNPGLNLSIFRTVANVLVAVFDFVIFLSLEEIARDFGSPRESSVRTLRIMMLVLNIAIVAIVLLYNVLKLELKLESFALLFTVLGVVALVAAIVSLFVIFKLRSDVNASLDAAAEEAKETPEAE